MRRLCDQYQMEHPGRQFKVQRFLTEYLKGALFKDPLEALLIERVSRIAPLLPYLPEADALRAFLRTLRPATAWAVIRTMLNGWTTTCRMHGPPPPPASGTRPLGKHEERLCLMGCPVAHDATAHYLECPILRGAVCDCLPRLLPPGLAPGALPLTAATRIVPVATCLHMFTHVYHAVRFEHGAALRRAGASPS